MASSQVTDLIKRKLSVGTLERKILISIDNVTVHRNHFLGNIAQKKKPTKKALKECYVAHNGMLCIQYCLRHRTQIIY